MWCATWDMEIGFKMGYLRKYKANITLRSHLMITFSTLQALSRRSLMDSLYDMGPVMTFWVVDCLNRLFNTKNTRKVQFQNAPFLIAFAIEPLLLSGMERDRCNDR